MGDGNIMAGNSLQIDDEYCKAMGQYFIDEGRELEGFLSEYISILECIHKTSIEKGELAKALGNYITYAKKIKGQINKVSNVAQQQCTKFVSEIDKADQYLF